MLRFAYLLLLLALVSYLGLSVVVAKPGFETANWVQSLEQEISVQDAYNSVLATNIQFIIKNQPRGGGCHHGKCWAYCGLIWWQYDWCYTYSNYDAGVRGVCYRDSDCSPDWRCSSTCTL